MILPPQDWASTPDGTALLAALDTEAGTTRLVGGAVRDALLGLTVSDIDFATELTPAEMMARLEAAGLKAVPTGIAHGTVTAVSGALVAEVTTLRRDLATDGRHAEVAFSSDWEEDAARRDFTINAMNARLPSGEVIDYFGGAEDLAARRVRFIGEPLKRIAEDHLRILRFFRFHARFGSGAPEAEGLAACRARARDLMALSRERIAGELLKMLGLPDPAPTIALMVGAGIWRPVVPEIDAAGAARLERLVARECELGVAPDPVRRLAALLPPDPDVQRAVARRLRLSRAQQKRLTAAATPRTHEEGTMEALAYSRGVGSARDVLLLAGELDRAAFQKLAEHRPPRLPVSGKDLIARGLTPGPEVSRRLRAFEALWIEAGFPGDRETLGALIAAALAEEKKEEG